MPAQPLPLGRGTARPSDTAPVLSGRPLVGDTSLMLRFADDVWNLGVAGFAGNRYPSEFLIDFKSLSFSVRREAARELVAEGHELSHELLDNLPPSRNQRYIRQLLVHTGILDERNEDLERIPGWLEHELADKPTAHANLARPSLNWFLLRRARQRAATRHHPASADRDLRRRVSVALDFLAWIDQRDLALADLAQEHIDDWITGATSQRRYLIRYFLKWTTSRRLTRELTVPSIPRQEPQDLLDDDDRWRLLQHCLTDDALPTDVRAGGAITLLFGPSTERLCHLTPEHLKFGDKHAHLVLGLHPRPTASTARRAPSATCRTTPTAAAALASPPRPPVALPRHGPGQADLDARHDPETQPARHPGSHRAQRRTGRPRCRSPQPDPRRRDRDAPPHRAPLGRLRPTRLG